MDLQIDSTWELVEKKALHASRFGNVRTTQTSAFAKKSGGVYEVDPEFHKNAHTSALAHEVAQLRKLIKSMGSLKQVEPSTQIVY